MLKAWREAGKAGANEHANWRSRFGLLSERKRAEFERRLAHGVPAKLGKAILAHKKALIAAPQAVATRKASELALEAITPVMPELVMGSADLTPSNNTRTKAAEDFTPRTPKGRYVRYGIREHGMAAAMNGITLHGGFRTGGGTFLVFADYARPSMRLAALMGLPVVYVMTHDSIGLGEDGPTHQPVEQIASLRAMPNMHVFRPADTIETAEAWQFALENTKARPFWPSPARTCRSCAPTPPPPTARPRAATSCWRPRAARPRSRSSPRAPRSRSLSRPASFWPRRVCAPVSSRSRRSSCCWRRTRPPRPRSSAPPRSRSPSRRGSLRLGCRHRP